MKNLARSISSAVQPTDRKYNSFRLRTTLSTRHETDQRKSGSSLQNVVASLADALSHSSDYINQQLIGSDQTLYVCNRQMSYWYLQQHQLTHQSGHEIQNSKTRPLIATYISRVADVNGRCKLYFPPLQTALLYRPP